MRALKGPFKVVLFSGAFMTTEHVQDYEVASQMAHDMVEAISGPQVFVAVYDREDTKLWSYELNQKEKAS